MSVCSEDRAPARPLRAAGGRSGSRGVGRAAGRQKMAERKRLSTAMWLLSGGIPLMLLNHNIWRKGTEQANPDISPLLVAWGPRGRDRRIPNEEAFRVRGAGNGANGPPRVGGSVGSAYCTTSCTAGFWCTAGSAGLQTPRRGEAVRVPCRNPSGRFRKCRICGAGRRALGAGAVAGSRRQRPVPEGGKRVPHPLTAVLTCGGAIRERQRLRLQEVVRQAGLRQRDTHRRQVDGRPGAPRTDGSKRGGKVTRCSLPQSASTSKVRNRLEAKIEGGRERIALLVESIERGGKDPRAIVRRIGDLERSVAALMIEVKSMRRP